MLYDMFYFCLFTEADRLATNGLARLATEIDGFEMIIVSVRHSQSKFAPERRKMRSWCQRLHTRQGINLVTSKVMSNPAESAELMSIWENPYSFCLNKKTHDPSKWMSYGVWLSGFVATGCFALSYPYFILYIIAMSTQRFDVSITHTHIWKYFEISFSFSIQK